MVRPDDGHKYYAYMLLCIDNCLCIHYDVETTLVELDKYFAKKCSISKHNYYLGAKPHQVQLNNGVKAWGMSSSKYVQEAISNTKTYLDANYLGWAIGHEERFYQ